MTCPICARIELRPISHRSLLNYISFDYLLHISAFFQRSNTRNNQHPAHHPRVAQMQFVESKMVLGLAHVCQITSVTHTMDAGLSAFRTLTVPQTVRALTTNAKIRAQACAVEALSVVLSPIYPTARVCRDSLETLIPTALLYLHNVRIIYVYAKQ